MQENLVSHGDFEYFCPNYTVYAAKSAFSAEPIEIKKSTLYNIYITGRKYTKRQRRKNK